MNQARPPFRNGSTTTPDPVPAGGTASAMEADAVAMLSAEGAACATGSLEATQTPLLSYGMSTSPNPVTCDGQAKLQFVVSNPGKPVTVTSLSFNFALGTSGTALADSAGDITPSFPEGWTPSNDGGIFYATPNASVAVIGTGSVVFTFLVNINDVPGTTPISITEAATPQGGSFQMATWNAPAPLSKFPAGFTLSPLSVSPTPPLAPGTAATLMWNGTSGATYVMTYTGGPVGGVNVGANGPWTTPFGLVTPLTFYLTATLVESGQTLVFQESLEVDVDVPLVVSFPQPQSPVFSTPVTLTWTTYNADYCQLYANGSLLDGNAPANPSSGYQVKPTQRQTTYSLYACKGSAQSQSSSVQIVLYAWSALSIVPTANAALLSPDGSRLYVALASSGINVYQASTNTLIHTIPTSQPMTRLAVSGDGTTLFAWNLVVSATLWRFSTSSYASTTVDLSSFFTVPASPLENTLAVSPDGGTLYIGTCLGAGIGPGVTQPQFAIVDSSTGVRSSGFYSFSEATEFSFSSAGIAVSNNGSSVFVTIHLANSPQEPVQTSLWQYDTAARSFSETGLVVTDGSGLALSPDQTTLYCSLAASSGSCSFLDLASGKITRSVPLSSNPSGAPLLYFAAGSSTVYAVGINASTSSQSLYFVDTSSNAGGPIRSDPTGTASQVSLAATPSGGTLYYGPQGGALYQLISNASPGSPGPSGTTRQDSCGDQVTLVDASEPAASAFSLPPFDGSAVDARIIDLGLLLGILQNATDDPTGQQTINTGWFAASAVLGQIEQIPDRPVPLIDLLGRLLGKPELTDSAGRSWYPIPYEGSPTGAYVVMPKTPTSEGPNLVGLGFREGYTEQQFSASATGYFPLFQLPTSGGVFVLGATGSPIEAYLGVQDLAITSGVNGIGLSGDFSFSAAPTLHLELLEGATTQSTYTTLQAILDDATFAGVVNIIFADSRCVDFFNQKLGSTTSTPGSILTSLGFLADTDGVYTLGDLDAFVSQDPLAFAKTFFLTVLKAVASSTAPLIPVGASPAGVYVEAETGAGGTDYGINLQLPPITLSGDGSGSAPTFLLHIGSWLTGEESGNQTSWWYRANPSVPEPSPGATVYLLHDDGQSNLSFTGKVELATIGVDYVAPAQNPLVDLDGFTLGGVELRAYLSIDLTDPGNVVYGGALRCDDIGIPLGSTFESPSGADPVVQNILASGGSGDPESADPVNPSFSVAAAFLSGSSTPFDIQLYDASGSTSTPIWFPLQRSFGPVHVTRFGVGWENTAQLLDLDFDGSVTLGPLAVDLQDLSIAVPVTNPLDPSAYSLGLGGMSVSIDVDPVAVAGSLLSSNGTYTGAASITVGSFALGAVGSYGTVEGQPSLFVFAFLNYPLGGPPFFFVTGVSAGFGYNSALTIPAQDAVQTFPFVAGLSDPSQLGGTGGSSPTGDQALTALTATQWVTPTRGEYWLGLGVQFTSFELVKSSVLVTVQFGKELEIAILGLSKLQLGSDASPYVYLELGLEALIKPADGTLLITGVLSPSSYVISPDCHVTGGFALAVWFSGPDAGDFVITVGGYHPYFTPPSYYPQVPRLGFNWSYSSEITIQGDAYFALTPGCAMAGGELDIVFQSGDLRAWFDAKADVFVQWKPFFFDAEIQISLGASYKLNLLFSTVTLTVEMGAGLELWGPPTGGRVSIDWYVISFSVAFGSDQADNQPNDWTSFQTLLPTTTPATAGATPKALSATRRAPSGPRIAATSPVTTPNLTVQMTDGLIRQNPDGSWVVRSDELAFSVRSPVPASLVEFPYPTLSPLPTTPCALGILPLEITSLSSPISVSLTGPENFALQTWDVTPSLLGVPTAMWGTAQSSLPAATTMSVPVGLDVSTSAEPGAGPPAIDLEILDYATVAKATLPISLTAAVVPASGHQDESSLSVLQSTVPSTTTGTTYGSILGALADFGFATGSDAAPVSLQNPTNIVIEFRAPVMLGSPAGVSWS